MLSRVTCPAQIPRCGKPGKHWAGGMQRKPSSWEQSMTESEELPWEFKVEPPAFPAEPDLINTPAASILNQHISFQK